MSSPNPRQLPTLAVSDFGPGQDHVAVPYQSGRIFAILHRNDPAHQHLPNVDLDPSDPYTYVFVHGGVEVTRFENLLTGTQEIPEHVVAELLMQTYGSNLDRMQIRMCSCYGNLPDRAARALGARSAVGMNGVPDSSSGAELMAALTVVKLKPLVHFREFPFGTITDPSMREFMSECPWQDQDKVLEVFALGSHPRHHDGR